MGFKYSYSLYHDKCRHLKKYFSFKDEIQITFVEYHLTIAELVIGILNSEKFGNPECLPAMTSVD
jgi:hypothetical protein